MKRAVAPLAGIVLACSLIPALLAPAAGQSPVRVEWGPILGHVTTASIDIAWRTSAPARSGILCDGRSFGATATASYHTLTVSGLQPGREYQYCTFVYDGGELLAGPAHTFRTALAGVTTFDFAAFGDNRSHAADHQSVVNALLATRPAFVLNTGDLVNNGLNMADWRTFFGIEGALLSCTPYYCVLGNHERDSDTYYSSFPLPPGGGREGREWYAFAYGNCFFVALDANRDLDEQTEWLGRKLSLEAARTATWRIAFFHEPPFSSGRHGGDAEVAAKWVPIFERCGVDLVFCGHDHLYDRSEKSGVTYIVTGGGGAPLYPVIPGRNPYSQKAVTALHFCSVHVDGDTLKVEAIKPDGTIIDDVLLSKQPRQ